MKAAAAACILASCLLAGARGVAAQCLPGPMGEDRCPLDAPGWVGHFTTLSANALLGGFTAGVAQHARGGSFTRGFAHGLLGGGVVSAGKWAAAQRFSGAGLAGRQIAAVGISMTRNAALGAPLLDELILPVGPARLYVRGSAGRPRVRVRIDAFATGWLIYGIAERELHFDAGGSVSAGAPVFRTRGTILRLGDDAHAVGLTNAGVVFLADVPAYGGRFTRRALAHERVHVLQSDQLFALWTDPAEDWLLRRLPGGALLSAHVDVGVSTELLKLLGRLFPEHGDRPWELEATFLAR
jgi:hypothetical protein